MEPITQGQFAMTSCPAPTELERAFAAVLDGHEEAGVVAHVEACGVCQGRLEALLADGTYRPRHAAEASGNSHSSALDQTANGVGAAPAPGQPDRWPEVPGYQILGRLGLGGMGVVYQARHERLNRVVALKMIRAGEDAEPDKLARFHLEAEAVARLRHPNIVAIHDVGTADGTPYIALEYLAGGSLEQRLRRGPLPARTAAELLAALAPAVHTAHLAGLVHRDLKPSNVLFGEDGTVKVTDFGLAKRLEVQGQTQTGQVIGTPAYMAPEQAKGESKNVGPAADVYALGALLYEALTGKAPFRGETLMQTLQMVLVDEPVPPRKLVPSVPADLETVCLKALRKEARERYPTAREFAEELDRFLHDEPVRARPLQRLEKAYRWCRRNPTLAGLLVAAAGLLLMAGVAGTLGFYHVQLQEALAGKQEQSDRAEKALRWANRYLYFDNVHLAAQAYHDNHVARARVLLEAIPEDQKGWEWHYLQRTVFAELLTARGHRQPVQGLAFARHGRWLASGSADATVRLWDARTGETLGQAEGHTGPVWGVSLSADGHRLASVAGTAGKPGELILWGVTDGATPQVRARLTRPGGGERSAVAFHPVKPTLALATGVSDEPSEGPMLLDDEGKVVRRWPGVAGASCVGLAWSGDGRRLAALFLPSGPSRSGGGVVLLDPDAAEPLQRVEANGGHALAVAFSPDGRTLATGGEDRLIELRDAADFRLRTTCRGHGAAVTSLAFTADGRVVSGSADTTIRVWDPQTGRELCQRRGHRNPVGCVAVAPVTGHLFSGSEDLEIRAWRPEQPQEAEEYLLHTAEATALAFSPDGTALVSVGLDGAVWRIDPAGHDRPRKLRQDAPALRQVRFLPGGKTVVVAGDCHDPGRTDDAVRFHDARDGTPQGTLATGLAVVSSLSLSRDGRWLAVLGQTPRRQTEAQVWDLTTRQRTCRLDAAHGAAVQLYPSGGKLLLLLADPNWEPGKRAMLLFDVANGCRPISFPPTINRAARFAVFSADESFVLAGGYEPFVRLFRVGGPGQFTFHGIFKGHSRDVRSVALSPDQKQFATASEDETICLWDLEHHREKLILRGSQGAVNDVAFSPSGGLLASASASGAIRVWDGRPAPQPTNFPHGGP